MIYIYIYIYVFHVYSQGETCNKPDPTAGPSLGELDPGTGPVSVTDDYDDDDLTLLQAGKPSASAECKSEDAFMIYDLLRLKITWYYCFGPLFKPNWLPL